jgi:G:T-mismatch repair DNA endonuclease (very short patch repair protein)
MNRPPKKKGWEVVIIWECQLKKETIVDIRIVSLKEF